MFYVTWAPLTSNLQLGLINEMVGADRGLENGRKDQDVHPLSPFLPCCGFGSGWVSVSVAISPLCTSLTWFQLLFSSRIPSGLEVIMTFCWVVPRSITYTCSLNSAHTFCKHSISPLNICTSLITESDPVQVT